MMQNLLKFMFPQSMQSKFSSPPLEHACLKFYAKMQTQKQIFVVFCVCQKFVSHTKKTKTLKQRLSTSGPRRDSLMECYFKFYENFDSQN